MRPRITQLLACLFLMPAAQAQVGTAPADARTRAPVDMTGYWVAVVTEDWRYRMMTPDKGDFTGIALNASGRAPSGATPQHLARRGFADRMPMHEIDAVTVPGVLAS